MWRRCGLLWWYGMVWYSTLWYHHTVRFVLGGTVPCIDSDMKNAKQRTVLDTCTLFQIFSRVCVTYGMYHHTYHTIPYMHRRCVCAVHYGMVWYHVMRTYTYTYVIDWWWWYQPYHTNNRQYHQSINNMVAMFVRSFLSQTLGIPRFLPFSPLSQDFFHRLSTLLLLYLFQTGLIRTLL